MNFEIILTPNFEKEAKALQKKYPSFKSDLIELITVLVKDPMIGVEVYKNCFKIRFPIKSKGKGKSGGGRLVICVRVMQEKIYLLSVFDKSEKENVTDAFLRQLLADLDEI
ncbi:addiction module toxin RelE [Limibacterium fermenti]|uniref:addiction module toxin RelE n=1 Tax=Limibacterium fermenti TaxID=3229863 RepID=UPI000E8EC78C|nr:hypothetical protein [Porphyromonadaceae bacterium]